MKTFQSTGYQHTRYDPRLKQRKLGCWVAMASYQTLALSSPSVPWLHVERE